MKYDDEVTFNSSLMFAIKCYRKELPLRLEYVYNIMILLKKIDVKALPQYCSEAILSRG